MHWDFWAESADQNKDFILEAIQPYLNNGCRVLEIGSGTGQHAVHFAQHCEGIYWQPSEHPTQLPVLQQNLSNFPLDNIEPAVALDAGSESWPNMQPTLSYSANTLHIMSWPDACQLMKHLSKQLPAQGIALFYGPFKFADRPFASSNAAFDQFLKSKDPNSGIRGIEALKEAAEPHGLRLEKVIDMPANNHTLVWRRD